VGAALLNLDGREKAAMTKTQLREKQIIGNGEEKKKLLSHFYKEIAELYLQL